MYHMLPARPQISSQSDIFLSSSSPPPRNVVSSLKIMILLLFEKRKNLGAGEMVHWLRTLVALAEDQEFDS